MPSFDQPNSGAVLLARFDGACEPVGIQSLDSPRRRS